MAIKLNYTASLLQIKIHKAVHRMSSHPTNFATAKVSIFLWE